MGGGARATVRVSNIPLTAIAVELFGYFEATVGSVYACEIFTARRNWKSKGAGRVQFDSLAAADRACLVAAQGGLPVFQRARLDLAPSNEDIVPRAADGRNRVDGARLHAGILAGPNEMEVFGSWRSVRAEIMPEKKKLELFVEDGGQMYKLEVMFRDIISSLECSLDGEDSDAVLLQLKYAPKIYVRTGKGTVQSRPDKDRYRAFREEFQFLWVRTPDFSLNFSIGKSCYLCLQKINGLLYPEVFRDLPFSEKLGKLTLSMGELSSPLSKLVPVISCPNENSVRFEILFQLHSLLHMQKISIRQVTNDLFDLLRGVSVDTAMKVLKKMQKLNSTCYDPVLFVKNQLSNMKIHQNTLSSSKSVQEQNLMSCYRVLITPSKMYCLGPELETSNYVVKHFSAYDSDFLRVSFVDEDWGKLIPDALSVKLEQGVLSKPHRTAIYSRILSVLKDGICIGSKKFEFLAFSASQLRSNSVWMFASNESVNAESIRQWMGHFSNIHSVSKCAARMGQLFSSSLQTINVPVHDLKVIPDVEVTDKDGKKYCFSDGIGKISLSFARQVAQKCGLTHTPSAFQIRFGGYKGVIAVDRTSFQKLTLRKSMLKFESTSRMLCVTKWSEYQPCYLNREIICLLSTLGIEDEVFESLQNDQITLLNKMLNNREVALRVLDTMSGAEIRTATKMLMQGYGPNSEPYLSMVLKAYREYQLSDIRSKCRVFVPKGRVLIGCLDETARLDYGQVFIKVTLTKEEIHDEDQLFFQKSGNTTAVIIGKVMVTKNPCLHPGDIRVLEAVYEVGLDDIGFVDCIVFPQKGKRPHPNECSGGDLDGDLYFISWDERLIPQKTDTPMDYTAPSPRLTDHDVTLEEIYKFFVDYMINDTLGVISTSHLVHADREPSKARSSECLELANLHSMAVDFAKTGSPAEMPRNLRPREFPDFMERSDRPMYISSGVFGKLYRAASSHLERQNSELVVPSEVLPQYAYDNDLEVEGFEAFLGVAEDYYDEYSEKLSSLMKYYGAEHEDEILTGNLRSRSLYLQRDKRRYGEVKDRILVGFRSLQKEVEGWFKSCCAESDSSRMASAWYHVTYHPNYNPETRFFSFPWILSDVLLNIKASNNQRRQTVGGPLA